jgi:hypothetical protein
MYTLDLPCKFHPGEEKFKKRIKPAFCLIIKLERMHKGATKQG